MSGAQSDHAQKAGKDRDMSATVAVSISWNAMLTGLPGMRSSTRMREIV
jgi:hypothetical protein